MLQAAATKSNHCQGHSNRQVRTVLLLVVVGCIVYLHIERHDLMWHKVSNAKTPAKSYGALNC